MEQLKKLILFLGRHINKLGLFIIVEMLLLMGSVLLLGSKPIFFDWLAYPPMILYVALPWLCDRIRGDDTQLSMRRLVIGFVIIFCLSSTL